VYCCPKVSLAYQLECVRALSLNVLRISLVTLCDTYELEIKILTNFLPNYFLKDDEFNEIPTLLLLWYPHN